MRFWTLRSNQPWIKNIWKKNSRKCQKAKLEFAHVLATIYTAFTQEAVPCYMPILCIFIRDLILVCEPGPGTNPPWILRDSCNCKIATRYFQILSIRMPQDIIFFWNGCISMCHPIRSSAVWPCHSLSSSGVYLFIPLNWGGPCNCSD